MLSLIKPNTIHRIDQDAITIRRLYEEVITQFANLDVQVVACIDEAMHWSSDVLPFNRRQKYVAAEHMVPVFAFEQHPP